MPRLEVIRSPVEKRSTFVLPLSSTSASGDDAWPFSPKAGRYAVVRDPAICFTRAGLRGKKDWGKQNGGTRTDAYRARRRWWCENIFIGARPIPERDRAT